MAKRAAAIPLIDLKSQHDRIADRLRERVMKVLKDGHYILGPEVEELEAALAAHAGIAHAVGLASGTDALLIALLAERIGRGDAVFLPSYSFVATAGTVVQCGAMPIYVDIDPDTFTIDPADLAALVDVARAAGRAVPRAVVAVDLFGLPARYDEIAPIANEAGLFLLADAAQSYGATLGDRRVGTLAPATATSFYPSKTLAGYGDAGALFTADDGRAAAYRRLRQHGQGPDRADAVEIGMNSRLDTLQAAILLEKLAILDDELAARRRIAAGYAERLADLVHLQYVPPNAQSAWSVFTVRIEGGAERRDKVRGRLQDRQVGAGIYYPLPIHMQTAYRRFADRPLPQTERLAAEALALPMHPYLTDEDLDRVAETLKSALKKS
ncbi:MAG: DegT/DnrJ/EryC1/StrS family aminotransferase [Sneathiellaceae bacterium]